MSRFGRMVGSWIVVSLAAAAPAFAQAATSAAVWEVEVHAGGGFGGSPTGGTPLAQFPTGAPVNTGGATQTTRAVSSWYYGDGASLLNQTNGALGVAGRITPLDAALRSALVERPRGGSFGARASRRLTPRLSTEFSVDYSRTGLVLSSPAETAIEDTRATFVTAWNGLLATGATSDRTVTSTANIVRGAGHQTSVTGAVNVRLGRPGRLEPYATAGAGAAFNGGTLPQATLSGHYRFLFAGTVPFDESDKVTVRITARERVFIGLFGGGVRYSLSARHGIRADVRIHLGRNPVDVLVDASPSTVPSNLALAVSTGTTPSVQFSTLPPQQTRKSSLSGPTVEGLQTFAGTGTQAQTNVSVGYFFRF